MNAAKIKAAVRQRDGNRCTNCGMSNHDHVEEFGRSLDVHRIQSDAEYALNDGCVTLCRPCHASTRRVPRTSPPFDLVVAKRRHQLLVRGGGGIRSFLPLVQRVIRDDFPAALNEIEQLRERLAAALGCRVSDLLSPAKATARK